MNNCTHIDRGFIYGSPTDIDAVWSARDFIHQRTYANTTYCSEMYARSARRVEYQKGYIAKCVLDFWLFMAFFIIWIIGVCFAT